MELRLNLDEDEFSTPPSEEKDESTSRERDCYVPKKCSDEWFLQGDGSDDPFNVKHAADLAYAMQNYEEAVGLYSKALSRVKGQKGVYREVVDSLSRASLRAGKVDEAEIWATTLLRSANPANVDQLTVSLDVLDRIYDAKGNVGGRLSSLTSVIEMHHHSMLPEIWLRLGETYSSPSFAKLLSMEEGAAILRHPVSSTCLEDVVACCYCRALKLLKCVDATVDSFAKEGNVADQESVNRKLQKLVANVCTPLSTIEVMMTRDLLGCKPLSGKGEKEEFQDLGSQFKRRAKVERESTKSTRFEFTDSSVFETKWFGFLVPPNECHLLRNRVK